MNRSAVISEDGLYRYRLDRWCGDGPRVVWVLLNPSTADADVDDPTIRRVMRFSRDWGYDGCTVLNVYAWRATKPSDLPDSDERAAGPLWNKHFQEAVTIMTPVVAAWGAHATRACQDLGTVLAKRKALAPTLCLGLTKDGHPRHPLYVPASTQPIRFALADGEETQQQ
jgi:hypothetical protein